MAEMDDSLNKRARKAAKIAKNPSDYKVCEGCDSIVLASAALCPNCHGYRFVNDLQSVISQAQELGRRARQSVLWDDFE
ncbi:MAG TPA: hypothetical protein VMN36_02555 [Verrucomicrobiales bacterium]|nr:hypothetical protein [Verrucomicrobiales bacterium]